MSLEKINELINNFCNYTSFHINDIRIILIVYDDLQLYTIELEVNNKLFHILHDNRNHIHNYYIYNRDSKFIPFKII